MSGGVRKTSLGFEPLLFYGSPGVRTDIRRCRLQEAVIQRLSYRKTECSKLTK